MQFLREIRTFSGKKAFFSCNFQLQSEARRRLLVRSCLGAPPATAHGGHWDVAATGDGLSVTQISWQFRGQLVGNSGHWAMEPWSPWMIDLVNIWAERSWEVWWPWTSWSSATLSPEIVRSPNRDGGGRKKSARWLDLSFTDTSILRQMMISHLHAGFFLAPSEATPTQFSPFEWQNASYWSDWLIVSGEYRAPLMFHSVWVCLPLNVQHYLLAGNRTHEPCRVAQVEQGPHEQLMKLFWVSGALARQSVITLECCTYIHTHIYKYIVWDSLSMFEYEQEQIGLNSRKNMDKNIPADREPCS